MTGILNSMWSATVSPFANLVPKKSPLIIVLHGVYAPENDDPSIPPVAIKAKEVGEENYWIKWSSFTQFAAMYVALVEKAEQEGTVKPQLHFDDGGATNERAIDYVLNLLAEENLEGRIIIFALPAMLGTHGYMEKRTVKRFAESGVEVGAHSMTHRDLPTLSREECLTELRESKARVAEITGRPVTRFAFPKGACSLETAIWAAREFNDGTYSTQGFPSLMTGAFGNVVPKPRRSLRNTDTVESLQSEIESASHGRGLIMQTIKTHAPVFPGATPAITCVRGLLRRKGHVLEPGAAA